MHSLLCLIVCLIPLSALAASIATVTFGYKWLHHKSHLPCVLGLGTAFVLASVVFVMQPFMGGPQFFPIYKWIYAGDLQIDIALSVDALTAMMLVMVTGISTLVALYARGYMHDDPGYTRFFAEISLFVFSMTSLVLAGNFLLMFVFWEAVGLCSYLLIGFWFRKPSAAAAAKKAFLVNRIGDFGFLLGMFTVWTLFGSLNYTDTVWNPAAIAKVSADNQGLIVLACMLLFMGAMGKSAQFPLHVWLPDAMEGPTPVSALIHAATMVTAGVYMVARCTPLFSLAPTAQFLVAGAGGITAILGALIALTQYDLKRVLAYSTISQLGFMFMALGAAGSSPETMTFAVLAAIFHLFTHAFFKALLFLGAGSVMHAMGNVIDMRYFGGLRHLMPVTHRTFLIGALALAGVAPLSGFWSKDDILASLHAAQHHGGPGASFFGLLYGVAVLTSFLTAFYTFRAYFMTFWGEEVIPPEAGHHAHESPATMTNSLKILSYFAAGIGLLIGPTQLFAWYVGKTVGLPPEEHRALFHFDIMATSFLVSSAGIILAWLMYMQFPAWKTQLAARLPSWFDASSNRFYLDEIFYAAFVGPILSFAGWCTSFDKAWIDAAVDRVGTASSRISDRIKPIQNGLVQSYAVLTLFGVSVIALLLVWQVGN